MTEETRSSKGGTELEEEAKPSIPKLEKHKGIGTRSLDKKKPPPIYKSPVAPKRSLKTLRKGGSSQKKPRGK